ncbi:hypothetical protein [Paenibacillus xerothermodurans]|uniref:Uncharacterized protein n=1 Tax=Paenibacillus xerothermodurans TaxID=1977292 RepID=A0A2W1NDK7_PAEXE|nr:hypothetical protein [Paenibacillus xerothermodurans]PZE22597.1 hypothetical protein CBW46_002135 [Paenibacillus xerothermodurans]
MDQKQLITFIALTHLLKSDHDINLAEVLTREQLQKFIRQVEQNREVMENQVSRRVLLELIGQFAQEHFN